MERSEYQLQQDRDIESIKRVAAKYEQILAGIAIREWTSNGEE